MSADGRRTPSAVLVSFFSFFRSYCVVPLLAIGDGRLSFPCLFDFFLSGLIFSEWVGFVSFATVRWLSVFCSRVQVFFYSCTLFCSGAFGFFFSSESFLDALCQARTWFFFGWGRARASFGCFSLGMLTFFFPIGMVYLSSTLSALARIRLTFFCSYYFVATP